MKSELSVQQHANQVYLKLLEIDSLQDAAKQEAALKELMSSPVIAKISHALTAAVMGMLYYCRIPTTDRVTYPSIKFRVISLRNSRRTFDFYKDWPLSAHVALFEGINAKGQDFDLGHHTFFNGDVSTKFSDQDLGHLGCTLSHFKLWESTVLAEHEMVCILEDDVIAMPYAKKLLPELIARIPHDADIVFINGRSSEKLFAYLGETPPYAEPPVKLISPKCDVNSAINSHFNNLPQEGGMVRTWSGTDGYILTARGLKKLKAFIHQYGIPEIALTPSGYNVDCVVSMLTTSRNDIENKSLGFDITNSTALALIGNEPYLNGYVSTFPIIETREKLGMSNLKGAASSGGPSEQEIDKIRDAAFSLPYKLKEHAVSLLEICHKYRPHGGLIANRLRDLKSGSVRASSLLTAQISLENRTVFVHIPKCGGTSIDNSGFFKHKVEGHRSLDTMLNMVAPIAHEFRVLTLSRNPWDRLASAFYYLSEGGCGSELDLDLKKQFVERFDGDFALFLKSFIDSPSSFLNCMHMAPAISFIKPSACTNPLFIQKLEDIENPTRMFEFLGSSFPIKHERKRRSYSNVLRVYTNESFEAIREIYIEDIFEFGYEHYSLSDISN